MKTLIVLALILLTSVNAQTANAQNFNTLVHQPNQFLGHTIQLTGKVIQSLQEGQSYILRINVTQETYGWKDTVLVVYKSNSESERVAEGDIIDVIGTSIGIQSYKAIF